jgi:hypothetical protein
MKSIAAITLLAASALLAGSAWGKLPAPSEEAKEKAEGAKATAAFGAKVAGYQLCKSQDRVAQTYREEAKKAGKTVPPATATPACVDPGPMAATAAAPPAKK